MGTTFSNAAFCAVVGLRLGYRSLLRDLLVRSAIKQWICTVITFLDMSDKEFNTVVISP